MKDLIPPPALPAGSTIWAYLRDSGGDSQEQSVGQQKDVIVAYCAGHGLTLGRVFTDEAKTGGTDKGRDDFAEMIDSTADADRRPAGLLIWSLSRFARNQNDSPYYRTILRRRGVIIHSLTEILPDDPTSIVIEAVYDFTNAEKLRQTSRDVKRGLHALVRQGYAPGGFPPRGYKAEKVIIGHKRDGKPREVSRWVIDEDLAPLVQKAWILAAQGKGTREVDRATGGRLYKSKSCWSTFFSNRTYLGILKCGDEEIAGLIPALVDQQTWDKVQAFRRARTQPQNRNKPHRGILSGLAVCPHCGSNMLHGNTQIWRYYICGKKVREGGPACPNKRINADKAEARILDRVLTRVFTPEMAAALIVQVQEELSDTTALDRELVRKTGEVAELKRRIAHLNDQIENFGPARSTQDSLLKRESELAERQGELAQAAARRAARQITVTPEALAYVINNWLEDVAKAREANDILAIQDLLKRFVAKIELGYTATRIIYRFPVNDDELRNSDAWVWGHHLR